MNDLYEYLKDKDFVAYDTETTGLSNDSEVIGYSVCAEESKAYYIILSRWDGKQLVYNNLYDKTIELLYLIKTKNIICHNAIFDCMITNAYFKVSLIESIHTDTMILAHLLDENRRVGLKELAIQYFGETSTKEQEEMKVSILANGGLATKTSYELYKADSKLIAKYGAKDAQLTYKLFMELVPELYKQRLEDFFYKDESMPLLRGPTYELNTIGLQVDLNALSMLKRTLQSECAAAKAFVYQEIDAYIKGKYPATNKKNVFNIGSTQQLSWLLFGQLKLEFSTLTDAGKNICKELNMQIPYTPKAKRDFIDICLRESGSEYTLEGTVNGKVVRAKKIKEPWAYIACDKETLTKLAPRYDWIQKLLEYQRKNKMLNTYVEGIEERVKYGIIQPSFLQHGTTSGRYSSRNPNFQNLPRDDKRIKSIIVSREGKCFVGADYSQLEPRVFAYYSKDPQLLAAFKGTEDFYSVIGMRVYNKTDCTPHKDGSPDAFGIKYKHLRDLSKVIALASTYGATAHQLAPTTKKSKEDTQNDIDQYFEEFPGVKGMMIEAHNLAKKDGQVTNIFGRPRRIPDAKKIVSIYGNSQHKDLPYMARQLLNLAVNHRVQSTGASIVNRAAIRFHNDCKELGINCQLVLQVHDSLVAECYKKDADTVKLVLQNAMETATILEGIDLEAVPKIGQTLAEV